jgi:hypothetical protein
MATSECLRGCHRELELHSSSPFPTLPRLPSGKVGPSSSLLSSFPLQVSSLALASSELPSTPTRSGRLCVIFSSIFVQSAGRGAPMLECRPFAATALNRIQLEAPVQIRLASVMVDDQDKALRFYTTNLGFGLQKLGVIFRDEPKSMGPITAVLFEDTCGNLINLVQPTA